MTWNAYDMGIASCVVCKKPQSEWDPKWTHSALTCTNQCFSAHFWYPKFVYRLRGDLNGSTGEVTVRWSNHQGVIEHMMCVPDVVYPRDRGEFLGFGGAMWYFEFTDGPHRGRVCRSNNVWSQGTVPSDWAALLPPNAISITKEEYDVRHSSPATHSG